MKGAGGRAAGSVAGAVVIGLLLSACAGATESASPGPSSLETETTASADESAEFASAANSVCRRSQERMDEVPAPGPPENWLGFGRRYEDIFAGTVDRLAALDPPPDMAGDYRRWVKGLRVSQRDFHALYRTVALRYPKVDTAHDRVNRAIDRAQKNEVETGRLLQLRLTDLYSCYDVTPWLHARGKVTAACGGFLFCR